MGFVIICASKSVSRVLSFKAIIYLGPMLPSGSRHLLGIWPSRPPVGVASDRVCRAVRSPARRWALTSPFHPYRSKWTAVYLCCTFP